MTPPTMRRCIQARARHGLEFEAGPRLKIQRPGHIQPQKARPKTTTNKIAINPATANAGMNLRAAAITWAAPNGQAISTAPMLIEQVEPAQMLLPMSKKNVRVVKNRILRQ